MNVEEIKKKLENTLTPKRFIHSVNVMKTSVELAAKHGEDAGKATIAGLLHDCARDIKGGGLFEQCERFKVSVDDLGRLQPELLHGPLGAELARSEYGINDEYVLRAIRFHTTGCSNMSLLDKIVFIADCIEPNRSFAGVEEIRRLAYRDIDASIIISLERTIRHVISKGTLIHPDTVDARNHLILCRRSNIYEQKAVF